MNTKIYNLLRQLNKTISNIERETAELLFFEPKKLMSLEAVLEKKYNKIEKQSPADLRNLFVKICKNLESNGGDNGFSLSEKEKKIMIFLLGYGYKGNVNKYKNFIIDNTNIDRRSGFRNAVYVYLTTYEANNPYTGKLRSRLMDTAKGRDNIDRIKFLKNNPDLINKNGHIYLAEKFKNGLDSYLASIEFPKALYSCRFVKEALMFFFVQKIASNDITMRLFREIGTKEDYDDLFSDIANCIIPITDADGSDIYKKDVIRILNLKLGDPRYTRTNYKWNKVTDPNRRLFLTWLNKGTLELFFKIIRDGVQNIAGLNTVDDRLSFWYKYLPEMKHTWVMLGKSAQRQIMYMKDGTFLGYGTLIGLPGQSLFMFQLGDYIFVEPSEGTLRIWKNNVCPIKFGEDTFFYSDLVYPKIEPTYKTPHTGDWQGRVRKWISEKCHNKKTIYYATYDNHDSEW